MKLDGAYTLLNAEEKAHLALVGFEVPKVEELWGLEEGDHVQLGFEPIAPPKKGPKTERMWVEVEEVGVEFLRGRLKNMPVFVPELKFDDEVLFHRRNVLDTLTKA